MSSSSCIHRAGSLKALESASFFCRAWVAAALGIAAAGSATADGVRQFRTSDPRLIAAPPAGARLVANYDTFAVYDVDAAQAATLTAMGAQTEEMADPTTLFLNTGTIDTATAAPAAAEAVPSTGKALWLVQFAGPIKRAWREALEATGVRVLDYIPNYTYLVYGDAPALNALQAGPVLSAFVQWQGAYTASFKVQPSARAAQREAPADGTAIFAVQLVQDAASNAATLALANTLSGAAPLKQQINHALGYLNCLVRLPVAAVDTLAGQPDVVSIACYVPPQRLGERQDQICSGNVTGSGVVQPNGPGYLNWLAARGFTQDQFDNSSFIVDIVDDGFDNGNAANPANSEFRKFNNPAQPSRMAYVRIAPDAAISNARGVDGHGNLNTSIVGGYNNGTGTPANVDSSGYHYGLGVCPFAHLASTKVFADGGNWGYPSEDSMVDSQYGLGCRISSDSWGSSVDGAYDIDSQNYDGWSRDAQPLTAGNQELLFVFAAGNRGDSGAGTIGSPGTAKNVFTIGASENVNPCGTDGSGVTDAEANNANDMATFSSRGPCDDQRKKPDIVGPGTHIHGAASYAFDYNGSGVSDQYNPAGQTKYCESSGTSHSTPALAGACALVRQRFLNRGWPAPSPAMTKAFLMNTTRYLTGVLAGDNLWSNNQGMGEVNLALALDDTQRFLRDEVASDTIQATGEQRNFQVMVVDPSKPIHVTLAWTDHPGSTTGNAYNNNLDLQVLVGAATYRGNVFSGSSSTTGGAADARNNVESVYLPIRTNGLVTVRVLGTNINSDGVPGNADTTDQDFAIAGYNLTSDPRPVLVILPATNITANTALLKGQVNPNRTNAWYRFEYGTSTNYGLVTAASALPSGTANVTVSNTVNSLTAVTLYHYRLVSWNASGTNTSSDASFTTLIQPLPPVVTTVGAGRISPTTATLDGTVNPKWAATTYSFQYGVSTNYGATTPSGMLPWGNSVIAVSNTISGLTPGTLYHYRITASNSAGTSFGLDRIFNTMSLPNTIFYEDFEHTGSMPPGWTQQYVVGSRLWLAMTGGRSGNPPAAHSGTYDACFWNTLPYSTRLVTPAINFGVYTNNAALTFWHCMQPYSAQVDVLMVYYKTSSGGSWNLLQSYNTAVTNWTQQTLSLPSPGPTYYIAFWGSAHSGYGVCIDDVQITATRSIASISAVAAPHGTIAPTGTVWVALGGGADFVVNADSGYYIADVLTNGTPTRGAAGLLAYTSHWSNVQVNGNILADFASTTADTGTNNTAVPWLRAHYTNAASLSDLLDFANTDTDGDGMRAWAEFLADTDPTNAASVLRFDAFPPPAGVHPVLQWLSRPTRHYDVYWTTNLPQGFLPLATNLPGVSPLNTYTDTVHTAPPALFYQIHVEP